MISYRAVCMAESSLRCRYTGSKPRLHRKSLGNKAATSREIIRNYFLNDFFKDHCQTYSVTGSGKRPIYWLFDSGKQNGFKALVYLHRYTPDTIGNLRIDYLHKMQRVYESEINRMQDMMDHSGNAREVAAAPSVRINCQAAEGMPGIR